MVLPRIGLPTYSRREDENDRFTLYAQYVDGVRRAGGLPLLIAPGSSVESRAQGEHAELFDFIDGWVLTGGGDVDPQAYGGERHEKIYNTDPERDADELVLIRTILERGLPALCICRGMQLLNVALGGTLCEHLADADECADAAGKLLHRAPPRQPLRHAVEVDPASRLAELLGETRLDPFSWHHQALRDVAPGFEVVARAPDGVVEAIESPDHPDLICVQWHPELSCAQDVPQQRLFDALVARAVRRRQRGSA